MLQYLTAGESHGEALLGILNGLPAGLGIDNKRIDQELRRRQKGYGRGPRMKIEKDRIKIVCGTRKRKTLGSPIGLLIRNKDFSIEELPKVTRARGGHADLAGVLKYGFSDVRDVLERASARETAMRVAIGAICRIFLEEFKIEISSAVVSIAGKTKVKDMHAVIDKAQVKGDTAGGVFEVCAKGVLPGLGSYTQSTQRLDACLASALMSIPGVKGVEIGLGFGYADRLGSTVHDAIYYSETKGLPGGRQGYWRKTNNAGGIEGGLSNGEDILLRACLKPISTLKRPLDSVDILTRKSAKAAVERSDVCVVEAAGVVGEAIVAFELTKAFLEKFGSDSLLDIKKSYQDYLKRIM